MRIAYYDDLHTEFGVWRPQPVDARVIVLAGDVATTPQEYGQVVAAVRDANPQADVVGILGNHEGYGNVFPDIIEQYRSAVAAIDRAHLLVSEAITIDGIRFLGTTLWTDLSQPGLDTTAEYAMNDYRKIRFHESSGVYRRLRATDTTRAHKRAVAWLTDELTSCDPRRTVVITHHAPSWTSQIHHDDEYKPFYCARLDGLIQTTQPAIWIHGHSHVTNDYSIGATHVVSNPRGYAGYECNPLFNETASMTIGD